MDLNLGVILDRLPLLASIVGTRQKGSLYASPSHFTNLKLQLTSRSSDQNIMIATPCKLVATRTVHPHAGSTVGTSDDQVYLLSRLLELLDHALVRLQSLQADAIWKRPSPLRSPHQYRCQQPHKI